MIARVLPAAEWPRLAGTEADAVWPLLDPARTSVVVVEDGDQIVGCHLLVWVLHAECLWVHPAHRGKSSVARRLWSAVQRVARSMGARTLATAAVDDTVTGLLAHVGAVPVPGQCFAIAVKES